MIFARREIFHTKSACIDGGYKIEAIENGDILCTEIHLSKSLQFGEDGKEVALPSSWCPSSLLIQLDFLSKTTGLWRAGPPSPNTPQPSTLSVLIIYYSDCEIFNAINANIATGIWHQIHSLMLRKGAQRAGSSPQPLLNRPQFHTEVYTLGILLYT